MGKGLNGEYIFDALSNLHRHLYTVLKSLEVKKKKKGTNREPTARVQPWRNGQTARLMEALEPLCGYK